MVHSSGSVPIGCPQHLVCRTDDDRGWMVLSHLSTCVTCLIDDSGLLCECECVCVCVCVCRSRHDFMPGSTLTCFYAGCRGQSRHAFMQGSTLTCFHAVGGSIQTCFHAGINPDMLPCREAYQVSILTHLMIVNGKKTIYQQQPEQTLTVCWANLHSCL
jgi:hypothetical protein